MIANVTRHGTHTIYEKHTGIRLGPGVLAFEMVLKMELDQN